MSVALADRLERLADNLEKTARGLRADASSLRHEASISPPITELRGRQIADWAVAVLAERDELHYSELRVAIEEAADQTIAGRDPSATLLATIGRDERIVVTRQRSGRYRLHPDHNKNAEA